MLMTDAMVSSHQPSLQISEDEVDDRHIRFGNLVIATFGDGDMIVTTFGETVITTPVVSDDLCVGHNRSLNEAAKGLRATIRHNGESDTTGIAPALAFVELGPRRSLPDLNGSGDNDFTVDAPAFSASSPPDITFVNFDVFVGFATYPILIWAHHAGAQLMENLESRLVTGDAKLPLQLHGRHARRLTGHQVGSPEPDIQWRMRTFHHCPHRQPCVAPALAASKDAGATGKSKGIAHRRTIRADESAAPTQFQQVKYAGFVVWEKSQEVWKGLREPKIVALMNVHEHGSGIIPSIIEGNNRIGMDHSIGKTGMPDMAGQNPPESE